MLGARFCRTGTGALLIKLIIIDNFPITITTITIYFIHPSRELKPSFDRTPKKIIISVILSHETHAHTHP